MIDPKVIQVVIGWKGGNVILQYPGIDNIPPHWIQWSPQAARVIARQLLEAADEAEKQRKPA